MKKVIVTAVCIVCIIFSMVGCGGYTDTVESLKGKTLVEFFEEIDEIDNQIVGISEKDIDKKHWGKGIYNEHYHGEFMIAGYDGTVSLLMENGKVDSIHYHLYDISSEEYTNIIGAAETVFGTPSLDTHGNAYWGDIRLSMRDHLSIFFFDSGNVEIG